MRPPLPVRHVHATAVRRVTPRLVRVTFGGEAPACFPPGGPDQQVKLFFPRRGQSVPVLPEPDADGDVMRWYAAYNAMAADQRPWMRSYTVRAHDAGRGTIDIDFVLHAGGAEGPATRWARAARAGDTLGMFGPSELFARQVDPRAGDWTLMVADHCALPALATVAEALPAGRRAVAYIEVPDAAEEQTLRSAADLSVRWLHGEGLLLDAVRSLRPPTGAGYAWLAGEADAVRALRRHLVDERGLDRRSVDFAGYWRRRLSQDDAPTPADLAEAQERLSDLREQGGRNPRARS
ncbi:siderophore-interacting protein [Streptomyces sp. SP18CS02]|uniref:siderophore-interacting protein n=1 Tax=Streptomyces sp. SP18CS02 TaxID=3002531 RepID=UPI002E7897E8|nr:siderophore-interacting protein [Streptomyces sp. SP18CS02]MEE1753219.1 siderophore-interacting protein [Streptomyces sp. SP18CS02]